MMNRLNTTITILLCFFIVGIRAQEQQNEEQNKSTTQEKLENLLEEVTADVMQEERPNAESIKDYQLEIDGLIIDETKTKIGRDFYDVFFTSWQRPQEIKGYTIYIYEMAHPRFGSWIWIDVDETTIYQTVLRPRYDVIEEAAQDGVVATLQFLFRFNQDQRQLSGQDMSGTGIY
jgi:curli production assembly/transport component CsgE